jgi:plant 4alpha-monomethylsterol monooxygenase
MVETVEAHSGYDFPYSPFNIIRSIRSPTEFHDYHHYRNVGNYGAFFGILDRVFGTDSSFEKYRMKQAEEEALVKED